MLRDRRNLTADIVDGEGEQITRRIWRLRYDRDGRRFEESARTDKYEDAQARLLRDDRKH